jgi:hypothetical protein
MISHSVRKVFCPTKLIAARRFFGKKPLVILDVGCGNRSYEIAKHWLNIREYVGIDREYWHDDLGGYDGIDRLIIKDLNLDPQLPEVPDEYFDLIILNHVIEHLKKGELVLSELLKKMKKDAIIYIETPDIVTINYPSAIGFMNFYDDPTHERIYEIKLLVSSMMDLGYKILGYGRRRDWKRLIIFSPLMIVWNLIFSIPFRRKIDARGLWDLFGVASFILASKK